MLLFSKEWSSDAQIEGRKVSKENLKLIEVWRGVWCESQEIKNWLISGWVG
jgi:hypothetical protein